mgnify:CR=1 FL=1
MMLFLLKVERKELATTMSIVEELQLKISCRLCLLREDIFDIKIVT